jgi:hypothetical protein
MYRKQEAGMEKMMGQNKLFIHVLHLPQPSVKSQRKVNRGIGEKLPTKVISFYPQQPLHIFVE